MLSIVPSIVETERIPAGMALNTTPFHLSRIPGPARAGILMTHVGLAGVFALNAVSYVPFILVALWVLPRSAARAQGGPRLDPRQLWASVREVFEDRRLRGSLLTVFATAVPCAPLITFCPVLVKEVFQGAAGQFGKELGAFGLGRLIGATGLLAVNPHHDRRPLSSGWAMGYAVIVVLATLNRWAWGLPALLVLAGVPCR